jgi:hypothetical protein
VAKRTLRTLRRIRRTRTPRTRRSERSGRWVDRKESLDPTDARSSERVFQPLSRAGAPGQWLRPCSRIEQRKTRGQKKKKKKKEQQENIQTQSESECDPDPAGPMNFCLGQRSFCWSREIYRKRERERVCVCVCVTCPCFSTFVAMPLSQPPVPASNRLSSPKKKKKKLRGVKAKI